MMLIKMPIATRSMWQSEKTTAPIRTGSCAVSYFEKKCTADERPAHWQRACCSFASFNAESKRSKGVERSPLFQELRGIRFVICLIKPHVLLCLIIFNTSKRCYILSATGKWLILNFCLILNDKTEMFSLWPHRTWVKQPRRVKKTKQNLFSVSVLTVATVAFPWQINNNNYSRIQSVSPILLVCPLNCVNSIHCNTCKTLPDENSWEYFFLLLYYS